MYHSYVTVKIVPYKIVGEKLSHIRKFPPDKIAEHSEKLAQKEKIIPHKS